MTCTGISRQLFTAITLFIFCATGSRSTAQTFSDQGFNTELVATVPQFTPVGLAWSPDGRLFIWQKNGIVRVVKNGTLLPTPFIDLSAKVNTYDDRGMWGLAFHPDFANNGYVYLSYVFEEAGNPNNTGPKTARLTRVTANPANPDVSLPGSEVVILGSIGQPPCSQYSPSADCIPSDSGSHDLGTIRFAADGKLFLGNGDGADAGFVDPYSMRSQDLASWAGKIFRLNPDGTAPGDNPFDDGTNSVRSKVWALGVRNPYRFALHPVSGEPYFGDVGWNTWEELNRGARGANFGWPCYEGVNPQSQYQSAFPQCAQIGPVTPPLYTYNHSQGSAAIAGPFYTGTRYPAAYRGNWFFGDYSGNWIRRVIFDASGNVSNIVTFATGVAAPVSIEQGPDELLYYASFTTGEIRRIRFNGPSAVVSASPTFGYSPLTVTFSSAGSSDPNGLPLSYSWDFGDGTSSTLANPSHTYTTAGTAAYNVRLTVTNSVNVTASASVRIVVGSEPPVPTISAPLNGTSIKPGQQMLYQGSAIDPDDGALPSSSLSWTILLHHNTHVHTFVGSTGSSGSFTAENHGTIGTYSYEVLLIATDSSGLTASTSVMVPVVADTTPPTDPAGLTATAGIGQVSLNWTAATDDASVEGYRVQRCQGAGCSNFVDVATSSGPAFADLGLAANTSYTYRVRAVDVSGNFSGYSNLASATTLAAPPVAGLVAAYSFNEGSGAMVADSSGNNNTGTISGASWSTQGKYSNALSFNGVSNFVFISGSPSLNVSSGMTLEAWIYPTANQSGWRTIMQREVDAYFLNASTSAGPLRPGGGGTFNGSVNNLTGPSASPVNVWTHVAVTYEGTILRLYVNGVQVSTKSASGTIETNSNPLRIGGNSPYGEYFNGLIDEVRVYNRALSQSEIQTDMNSPIVAPSSDTTPPSAPGSLTASAAGTSQINLSWSASTDDVAVTGYRVERCPGAGCSNFVQVATPSGTSYSDSGLTQGTTYLYRVRATDAAANLSDYSNVASTSTQADTTPPSVPGSLTASAISTSQINLSWNASTDNVAVTGYRVERCQGAGCSNFVQVATPSGTSYSDTGLTIATAYSYRVRATDAAANLSDYSTVASTSTQADTTSPSAPGSLTASAVSTSQINLSWSASTDNVAVTGYRLERCQGVGCSNFAQIATPSGTSYSDTGLTIATAYSYRVRATDAATNLSGYSNVATSTTFAAPDTTPPSAPGSLTASAVSISQINLSWSASTDNVAVSGYRVERCQGTGCSTFAQIATPTGLTYNDTGLSAGTSYSYRVRATDAAGNLGGYSAVPSATTLQPPPSSGLVAAYAFNEGTGTTVADSSGNNNTGTINGASWSTQGKFSNALSFNGTSNMVVINSSPSLNVSSAMTLEAWIYPTANQSGWRTIMQREVDAYFLNASTSAGPLRPGGGGTFNGSVNNLTGPSASPVNVWTHVAVTYDGTILRLYVNGVQVSTKSASGAIQTNANPLRIGGNSPYGEYFNGLIDEVRVYNRALSQSEIQTDMNSPIVAPSSDTTPPSAPGSLTASAAGTSQINLSWSASTDDVAVTGYRVERCQGAGCSNFAQVATPSGTSYSDTGLTAATPYSYRVRATDAAANLSDYSNTASTSTQADTTPPSAPASLTASAISTSQINLSWSASTDNVAVTGYRLERCQGAGCSDFAQVATPSGTGYSDTGLIAATAYSYRVRATDAAANLSDYSTVASTSTQADTTPPSAPGSLTASAVSTSQINLSWSASTDNVAVTGYRLERCQGAGCSTFTQIATPSGTSYSDSGLTLGTTYLYRLRATDAAGNLSDYSNIATTSTLADTTPPSAPANLTASAAGTSQINLSWSASTDNVAVTGYRVERCQGSGCSNFVQVATPSGTSYSDSGLTAATPYSYRVRATDADANLSDYSNVASTSTQADTTSPSAPASLTASAASTSQINLSWSASTDNIAVTGYRVERCQGSGCSNFVQVATPSGTSYSDTGLTIATAYSYRVRATDAAANLSDYSNVASTSTQADTTPPSAPGSLTASAASTSQINLSWSASTDNVAVTGYRVERCQGAGCSNFAQIATPSGTSYSDTGLTTATAYSYRVRATDAATNLSGYSNVATSTTFAPPDTTPPSAPTNLTASAVSASQINLSWSASTDNIAVTGYRVERCQGTGCSTFAQIATPTGLTYNDTGLSAGTSYSYRVRATDAAGNLGGYSAVPSATTLQPPPSSGLVAAYAFNEGTGTTVADSSGNNNTGTINGASWSTQGKFSNALSFNGTSNMVVINSSPSLNVSSAMTLEAWIYPTANQSGWRTIMQREVDAYFLNASNSSGARRPAGGGTFNGAVSYLSGPSANPLNAWTHVALTYDGTILRLYVNGTQVATKATTGLIETNSSPLRIGGNSPYGEFFNGRIDEVRIYNRALSQSEIQTDMNTPIVPNP